MIYNGMAINGATGNQRSSLIVGNGIAVICSFCFLPNWSVKEIGKDSLGKQINQKACLFVLDGWEKLSDKQTATYVNTWAH